MTMFQNAAAARAARPSCRDLITVTRALVLTAMMHDPDSKGVGSTTFETQTRLMQLSGPGTAPFKSSGPCGIDQLLLSLVYSSLLQHSPMITIFGL